MRRRGVFNRKFQNWDRRLVSNLNLEIGALFNGKQKLAKKLESRRSTFPFRVVVEESKLMLVIYVNVREARSELTMG